MTSKITCVAPISLPKCTGHPLQNETPSLVCQPPNGVGGALTQSEPSTLCAQIHIYLRSAKRCLNAGHQIGAETYAKLTLCKTWSISKIAAAMDANRAKCRLRRKKKLRAGISVRKYAEGKSSRRRGSISSSIADDDSRSFLAENASLFRLGAPVATFLAAEEAKHA